MCVSDYICKEHFVKFHGAWYIGVVSVYNYWLTQVQCQKEKVIEPIVELG